MINIKLDKTTRIRQYDKNNLVLEDYRKKEKYKGKETTGFKWFVRGYYGDLVSLAQDYIENAPRKQKATIRTIEKLIKTVKQAEKNIIKKLSK